MDPAFVGVPDHRFGSGADDEFLLELGGRVDDDVLAIVAGFQAVVGDHGTLLGEALDVFSLAGEEALWNEQWEVGVLHAHLLKVSVQGGLHLLPDSIAVRLDDHASAHGSLLGQICFHH